MRVGRAEATNYKPPTDTKITAGSERIIPTTAKNLLERGRTESSSDRIPEPIPIREKSRISSQDPHPSKLVRSKWNDIKRNIIDPSPNPALINPSILDCGPL